MPAILIVVSGELRDSISDYAYSSVDNLFSGMLWLASSMFCYNAMYTDKKYNWFIAISLLGVSLTDHIEFPTIHYIFASLFFIGSIFVMVVFSSVKQRVFKIYIGAVIIIALLGYFSFRWYSLLVAEWICLLPISIHFIGESLNKID